MEEIKVNVKLELRELLKLRYSLLYKSAFGIFFTFIGLGSLCAAIMYFTGNLNLPGAVAIWQIAFGLFFLAVIPFSIFTSSKKDFETNKFVAQQIAYTFAKTHFFIKGETFNMENSWGDLAKIIESDNWFILYTSKTQALFIPKNRFDSPADINAFKALIRTQNVVQRLK